MDWDVCEWGMEIVCGKVANYEAARNLLLYVNYDKNEKREHKILCFHIKDVEKTEKCGIIYDNRYLL